MSEYRPAKYIMTQEKFDTKQNDVTVEDKSKNKNLSLFKANCLKLIPELAFFRWNNEALKEEQWQEALNRFDVLGKKKLTATHLIYLLSEVLETNFESISSKLQKKNPGRSCKRKLEQEEKIPRSQNSYSKKRKREIEASDPSRQVIVDDENIPSALKDSFKDLNLRVTSLTPGTPTKEFAEIKRTPGKRKVRPFYTKEGGSLNRPLTFYTPISPEGKKGMVVMKQVTAQELKDKIPTLAAQRAKPITFQVFKKDIKSNTRASRRINQKSMTGATCQQLFAAHGVDTIIKIHGSEYHWSHIWGLFLGGQHSVRNLIPTTAAANYNMLKIFERYVAKRLTEDNANSPDCIQITAIPKYEENSDSLIPIELKLNLSWEDKDTEGNSKKIAETITINTRSYRTMTDTMVQAISFARDDLELMMAVIKSQDQDSKLEDDQFENGSSFSI